MAAIPKAALAAPTPGVVWGLYPQRGATDRPRSAFAERLRNRIEGPGRYHRIAREAQCAAATWERISGEAHTIRVAELRARLRRQGLEHDALADALGCVADAARRSLGVRLYATQLFAAAVLLDRRLAEMATGEGKTHAAGAAAAVAALAGIPVHVITANDYLVARDADALAPWYAALGLQTGYVVAALDETQRRIQYRGHVVYCTARELVFDYLRDGLTTPGRHELVQRASALTADAAPPRLRGLCMAILDEADNVLLDEAVTPLVLSAAQANPERRAFLWQALALARELRNAEDFTAEPAARRAHLTERGRERLARLSAPLGAPWRMRRRAEEAIAMALAALHLYRCDRDYVIVDDRIVIVDPHTGRAAPGRAWSQGLHGLIELKERKPLSADTRTLAQITYQRFFPRYLRLCGMSGTLREARRELSSVYGLSVVEVPLRRPSRRQRLPAGLFDTGPQRWQPLIDRIRELHASGRPVLIGTGSVSDSEALGCALAQAGIPHRVLNARHHAEEAAIVAHAGRCGAVTIATQMAGRGTDIVLEPEARELGGLHVIDCQDAAARRLERQLAGRCARQGDPGSFERWMPLDSNACVGPGASIFRRLIRYLNRNGVARGPHWLVRGWILAHQWTEERRGARARRLVLQQDRAWQRCSSFTSAAE
jgi:preprotein translocase subunit SecA